MPVPDHAPQSAPASSNPLMSAQQLPQEQAASSDRLATALWPEFFLIHWPGDWSEGAVDATVDGVKLKGAYWLPQIVAVPVVPGANGFRSRRGEQDPPEEQWASALEDLRRKGAVVIDRRLRIPAEMLPAGSAPGSYMRGWPAVDPRTRQTGDTWCEAWLVPMPTPPGMPQRWRIDHATRNAFRAWLVLSEVVKPPVEVVVDALVADAESRRDEAYVRPYPDEVRKLRVKAAEAQVATVKSARIPARPAKGEPAAGAGA